MIDATGTYTDRVNAVDAELVVRRATNTLAEYMREHHDAVTSFVGGDNVIALCPVLPKPAYDDAIEHVRAATDVDLRVGVGTARSPFAAGQTAKHALETGRETGATVTTPDSEAVADD